MKGRIAWLVPYPLQGSGGHRTLFSHIRNLADRGHECHVYIGEDPLQNMEEGALREVVENFFGPCPARIHSGYQVEERYDLAVATAWWTAEVVAKKVAADHKLYFVQDFEPWFHAMGDLYIKAESSYRQGLVPLTIGRWLPHLLRERYGSSAYFFEFTADRSVYYPLEQTVRESAVCFICQPEKARRCPGIGGEALAIVKHHCPEVNIYTYGSGANPGLPCPHSHLGILELEACNRLYNQCAVGLCLSSSNPSRIPFEMMAAGLPVVEFHAENTVFDLPEGAVLLAERNPSSLAGALIRILRTPELQASMRRSALAFMENRQAQTELEQCADHIEAILAGRDCVEDVPSPLYVAQPFSADLLSPPPATLRFISAPVEGNGAKISLLRRIRRNRIGRALQVLWRGYC